MGWSRQAVHQVDFKLGDSIRNASSHPWLILEGYQGPKSYPGPHLSGHRAYLFQALTEQLTQTFSLLNPRPDPPFWFNLHHGKVSVYEKPCQSVPFIFSQFHAFVCPSHFTISTHFITNHSSINTFVHYEIQEWSTSGYASLNNHADLDEDVLKSCQFSEQLYSFRPL